MIGSRQTSRASQGNTSSQTLPFIEPDDNLERALDECGSYSRMGGLDEQTMRDIAHDNRVDYETLRKEWFS